VTAVTATYYSVPSHLRSFATQNKKTQTLYLSLSCILVGMLVIGQVLLLLLFSFGLIKSTELIVAAIRKMVRRSKVGGFGVTAFILALATSLPELVVGITASIEGLPQVVLGNVLGSNIANVSLVIGGAAIAGGKLRVAGETLKRDLYLVFGVAVLPLLLIADSTLSRADGVVLLIVYVLFVTTVLKKHTRAIGKHVMEESPVKRLFLAVAKRGGRGDLVRFLLGVVGLLLSSHMIVQLSEMIALGLGLPILIIGLFLVAIGTSLPELVFEMKAVVSGQIGMVWGDLLGSVVANATLVLGLSSVIAPMKLNGTGLAPYSLAIGSFVMLYSLFVYFARSKSRLERWEGVVLLLLYFGFVVLELGRV